MTNHTPDIWTKVEQQGEHKLYTLQTRDFATAQAMRVAPQLLEALTLCHEQLSLYVADGEQSPEDKEALDKAALLIEGAGRATVDSTNADLKKALRVARAIILKDIDATEEDMAMINEALNATKE